MHAPSPARQAQPTAGQRALAQRIAREGAPAPARATIDAEVYLSTERFAAERSRLFGRVPLPVMPSALLPAGHAMTHDGYGVPLLLTRDREGRLFVGANLCRHRGTRLLDAEAPVAAARITCPYHAWTYALDGRLIGVPRQEVFAGFERAEHGLAPLPACEAGGIVWVGLDAARPPDFAGVGGELAGDFAALGLEAAHVHARRVHRVEANWKLIADAFLEPYHVSRLHAGSIGPFFADAVSVSDRIAPHFRSAVGRADFASAAGGKSLDALRQAVTFSYTIFPNGVLVVSPDYVNLMVLMPVAPDLTLVEDFMLVPEPPASEQAREHWDRSWALLDGGVFAGEDFVAAARSQRGLASGALPELVLGGLETGLRQFHDEVERALG